MFRLTELILVYALAPLVLLSGVLPRPWIIYLFLAGLPIGFWLRYVKKKRWDDFWSGTDIAPGFERIISRFGISALGIVVITITLYPDRLLEFPASYPVQWLGVMFLYPLIMVYPQELFFRMFFVSRYETFLGSRFWVITINAMVFGWAHILYGNWLAVVLSGIGGAFFMDTYLRTRSMKLVVLEHALYGNLIFTVGLGEFFYSGWAG